MSQIDGRFYVESVSFTTVTLEPDTSAGSSLHAPAGTGPVQIVVTTRESTADSTFWGATGTCGRFRVIFQKLS